ncbi:hypothetical protein JKP88DRAFT_188511 [Tribonema minus]|uniref:Uncharacterized protein n=1 Tax=Tribonema minus TaxID=303371 RepID=A0A835YPT6_9STRA|nr:hypothetical protein JKP88DRAFT_188511 [Tribonema minus]
MLGTGGAYDGRGQLSPRTLAAQTAALQRVLREQGLERGFSGIVDATRRYLAVLLRDRYARPLRWAAEELARKGVDPDVAKQIQLRQARFRLPGSADWLRNVTLKDIIYKSLERCRAAFDCQDPATGAPVNLLDLYQDLERVLLVSADPGYVYERLQQLAADAQLGGVRWDGGGAHAGAPWSPALPTDAELVMHVFVCRCNELLARTPAERLDGAPFASRFYDEVPAAALDPGRYRSRVVLVRTDVRGGGGGAGGGGGNGGGAPHYQVVAGGEVWTVPAGRLNVFQAIALFLWAVKRFKSGYLGDVNLRHEVLDDVFIESPAVG